MRKHSPSISVSLFVLVWVNLRNHIYPLQSKPQVVASSNHLIEKHQHWLLAAPCSNISLWYKPITEQLIHALFLFLYSPEGIYCFTSLFTLKRPQTVCPTSCSPAVSTIAHRQRISWRYCRVGDIIHVEMSHWACHSAPVTAGRFIVLCRASLPHSTESPSDREADISLIQSKVSHCYKTFMCTLDASLYLIKLVCLVKFLVFLRLQNHPDR